MSRIAYRAAIVATALSLGVFAAGAAAEDITNPSDVYPDGGLGKVGFGSGCEDGHGCAWDGNFYVTLFYKWKIPNDYGYYHLVNGPAHSAKHRYNDRKR